eukprot:240873_1
MAKVFARSVKSPYSWHVRQHSRPLFQYSAAFNRSFSSVVSKRNSDLNWNEIGHRRTKEWRMIFERNGDRISPWHDIDLYTSKDDLIFNMVTEVPRSTQAKNEMSLDEKHNPLKQDIKNGALRFFKYGDIPFNYGFLPQTWESPKDVHPETGLPGDNDPIDVVEISDHSFPIGSVVPVKVLGVYGLIDEGETDWKVVVVACDNILSKELKGIEDLQHQFPWITGSIVDWFRYYKVPDGSDVNQYTKNAAPYSKDFALKVISETHTSWKDLVSGKVDSGDICLPESK